MANQDKGWYVRMRFGTFVIIFPSDIFCSSRLALLADGDSKDISCNSKLKFQLACKNVQEEYNVVSPASTMTAALVLVSTL